MSNFCHLHVHDEYSTLDGFGSPKKFVNRASELGFKHLAVTNHGNIDSAIAFQKACAEKDILPIIGCELYIDKDRSIKDKSSSNRHICVFVKNRKGWKNLLKMLTIANLEGFYKKPRIDSVTLLKHCEGLAISTACIAGFVGKDWGIKLFKDLIKKIPNDLYLEIMPHNMKEQIEWNKKIIKLSDEYDIPIIATNDCHYPTPEDALNQEYLLAINSKAKWDDKNRFKFDVKTLYLCSRNEMKKMFRRNHKYMKMYTIDDALDNTIEIAEKCSEFRIKQSNVNLPLIPEVTEGGEEIFFKDLIYEGMVNIK